MYSEKYSMFIIFLGNIGDILVKMLIVEVLDSMIQSEVVIMCKYHDKRNEREAKN